MTLPESKNSTRKPMPLGAKLNRSLVSYVAAAGAAGTGMLAGAQPADAEVVYTPANTPILVNTPLSLDLNNDGTADFVLSNNYLAGLAKSCTVCSFFENAVLKEKPLLTGNAGWAITSSVISHSNGKAIHKRQKGKTQEKVAAPAFWGVVVGSQRKFQTGPLVMDSVADFQTLFGFYSTKSVGQWGKGRQIPGPYLGLKFMIGNEVHYGWARVVVSTKPQSLTITATLTGYAYETVPNRPIITGVTQGTLDAASGVESAAVDETSAPGAATLGRLAQGATGVPAWRARQSAQNAAPASGK